MAPNRRRRRNQGRVIAGEVITAKTELEEDVLQPESLPEEPQSASETPIFDQMMAEQFTGHDMVTG